MPNACPGPCAQQWTRGNTLLLQLTVQSCEARMITMDRHATGGALEPSATAAGDAGSPTVYLHRCVHFVAFLHVRLEDVPLEIPKGFFWEIRPWHLAMVKVFTMAYLYRNAFSALDQHLKRPVSRCSSASWLALSTPLASCW